MRSDALDGDDLIPIHEAARILGVTVNQVYHMVRVGKLRPRYDKAKGLNGPAYYRRDEVGSLIEAKERGMSPAKVSRLAVRAYACSRTLERRMELLEQVVGARLPPLPVDEEEVLALYAQARDDLEKPPADIAAILAWTRVFIAAGEEFFDTLEAYTGDEEAWMVFFDLARTLEERMPREQFAIDKELETVNGYLMVGRKNLRVAIFFHIRNKLGPQAANRLFHSTAVDIHEDVLATIAASIPAGRK